ncbi:FadR/GntR family transcriptional regulator [Glutamicibacter sp. Je.9.36]|uniref:FadR/GntR family transcriptional regulator n=1 Tax=Glutamicibacter sp. Je.9.36 TaxID=3142837 RepID=UPI003DA999FF
MNFSDRRGKQDPLSTMPARRSDARARLRALTNDITALILERGLLPGDPLPTEQELMAELGVGRNSLREAIKVLQALGIIDTRHGFGMFVAQENLNALHDSLAFRGQMSLRHHGHEASELVDVRQALETGLIGLAIRAVTDEHLEALEQCVIQMEQHAAREETFVEQDKAFHRILFEPLGNQLLTNLLGVFWDVYRTIYDAIDSDLEITQPAKTAQDHRDILDAVRAKDVETARQLISEHFHGIRALLASREV